MSSVSILVRKSSSRDIEDSFNERIYDIREINIGWARNYSEFGLDWIIRVKLIKRRLVGLFIVDSHEYRL